MSEQPEMNVDPMAEKLGRFTPNPSGLDRDALLFQAGKASARATRFWPIATGLLLLTQSATLILYFMKANEPATLPVAVQPREELPQSEEMLPVTPGLEEARQWSYRKALLTADLDDLPKGNWDGDMAAVDEVWTVRSISSATIID